MDGQSSSLPISPKVGEMRPQAIERLVRDQRVERSVRVSNPVKIVLCNPASFRRYSIWAQWRTRSSRSGCFLK